MRYPLALVPVVTLAAACSQPPAQTIGVAAPPPPAPAPVVRPAPKSSANFRTATATVRDAAGMRVGTVTFADSYGGLIVTGSVEGLGIGAHGIHIHEFGKCEPPFASAGSHFNPEKHKHGFKNADGPHLGDLPNIDVPPSGKLQFEFLLPDVTLRGARATSWTRAARRS